MADMVVNPMLANNVTTQVNHKVYLSIKLSGSLVYKRDLIAILNLDNVSVD